MFEDDERDTIVTDVYDESVHVSMLDFCKMLHKDISESIDEWSDWECEPYDSKAEKVQALAENKKALIGKLECLSGLINENDEYFSNNHCFFQHQIPTALKLYNEIRR